MKKILFASAILFAAACGGKSKKDSGDPCADPCKGKKSAMTCEGMADAVGQQMAGAPDMDEASIEAMKGVVVDQCTSMAWSQETIDCMAAATGPEGGEACVEMMSEEQKASLSEAMNGGGGEEMDEEM